jgi:dihydrodipicolinate synthase/N-acetylneuraminate lyase
MTENFLQGNRKAAKELETLYATLIQSLGLETNPPMCQICRELAWKCQPNLRLPLLQPREATKLAILQSSHSAPVLLKV